MNIAQALKHSYLALEDSESPELDSQFLLCHVLNCPSSYLHGWAEQALTQQQQQQFEKLIKQRQQGKPIAHIIGQRGFWSLDLNITSDTLIPRPDTELLVELALIKIGSVMRIADLGTGSGAIALALAKEQPNIQVLAMDYSSAALTVAKKNAEIHQLNNVLFWQGQWLSAISDKSLDMIISNPPYVCTNDPHLLQDDVRFEPLTALVSGDDGLKDIRTIIKQARRCLITAGWLLIEHGYDQAQQVQQLFRDAGFINVSSHQDFGGNERVVMGQINER